MNLRRVIGYASLLIVGICLLLSGGFPCHARQIVEDEVECDSLYEVEEIAAPMVLADESSDLPSIPYHTPEAAAFTKFGDYAVGGYTGRPDIRLPVCELTDRDLKIPIVLNYDARGIKVAQEASWVGLGWDLAIGGCINTVMEGNLDNVQRLAPWSKYVQLFGRSNQTEFTVNANPIVSDIYQDMANGVGEFDFYHAGFLGHSIVFFKDPYTDRYEALCDSSRVYSIERPNNTGWTIRDDQGYEYSFEAVEYTTLGEGPVYQSAWYLTSILSPQGASAEFYYETTEVRPQPMDVETYDVERKRIGGGNGDPSGLPARYQSQIVFGESQISQPWLQKIVMRNQTVYFDKSARTDFFGALKLDKIRITDPSGTNVSKYHFNYGTFAGSNVGGRCLDRYNSEYSIAESTRLKLESMSRISVSDADSITYRFTYQEDYPLPFKTSYARDFWGYYNGAENVNSNPQITNSRSVIPPVSDCMINYKLMFYNPDETTLSMKGAQRFSNRKYITSGVLKRITYPTGGYTEFGFEPHVFLSSPTYPLYGEGYRTIGQNLYFSNPAQPNTTDHARIDVTGTARGTVKLLFSCSGNTKIRDLKGLHARLYIASMSSSQTNSITIPLDSCYNVDENSDTYSCLRYIELPAGSYMASVSFNTSDSYYSNTGSIWAELSLRDIPDNIVSGGAGLRIARIENFDSSGKSAGRTDYVYNKTDGTPSGEILCDATVMEPRTIHNETGGLYEPNYSFNSYGVLRLHSSFNGVKAITSMQLPGDVGYHTLLEKEYDKDGILRKTTEKQFNLVKATCCLNKFYLMKNPGGGELTSTTVFDSSGKMAARESHQYVTKSDSPLKVNAFGVRNYYNDAYKWHFQTDSMAWERTGRPVYTIYVYSYPRHWRVLSSTISEEFTPDGVIKSKSIYSYNQKNHLISDETIENTNNSFRRRYLYPTDYNTGTYAIMAKDANHMTGVKVESQSFLKLDGTEKETEHTRIDYSYNSSLMMPFQPTNYQSSKGGAALTSRMTVKYDDDSGNIVEMIKEGVQKTVILWSYDNLYPVAIIEGASLSDVKIWAGAQFISQLSAATTGIGTLLTSLRSKLSGKNVLVTTCEHIPLVGISKEVLPNGDIRHYRYDGFNRLTAISDADGNVIEQYEYNYDN